MKIIHLSYADIVGGAAKATYRIHQAQRKNGINSQIFVNKKLSKDVNVFTPRNIFNKFFIKIRPHLIQPLRKTLFTKNNILHSPNLINSVWYKILNKTDADLINLHWIQKEMISIKNITQIKKPIVWTFHDMWPMCGAEHVSWDSRWENGYLRSNRPIHEGGFDLNRYVWNQKRILWKKKFRIVTPSSWLAKCVNNSYLFRDFSVTVIPHCLDLDKWKPLDKDYAREILDFPKNEKILLIGTLNSNDDHNKGFDLIVDSLKALKKNNKIRIVIFGQDRHKQKYEINYPTDYFGRIDTYDGMRELYSAADLMLVPSRIESFSNIAMEAQACGTPVVAFRTSGLIDVVEHMKTGYLANKYDPIDFAYGINWSLENLSKSSYYNYAARERAYKQWNQERVSSMYKNLYQKVIEDFETQKNK